MAVDGRPVPQPLHLRRGDGPRLLKLSAPGFAAEEQSIVPAKDLIIQLGMQKEKETALEPVHRTAHKSGDKHGPPRARGEKGDKPDKPDKNVVTDL